MGKKFEDVALTEMLKALDELETALEETEKFLQTQKVFWQTQDRNKWGKTNESSSGNYRQYQLVDKTRKRI